MEAWKYVMDSPSPNASNALLEVCNLHLETDLPQIRLQSMGLETDLRQIRLRT